MRSSLAMTKLFFFSFFFQYRIFFLFCQGLCFSSFVTTTSLVRAWLTGHPLPPNFTPTCPISLPTLLHLYCACCALSSPQHPSLHANKTFFFSPLGTASARSKPLEVCFAPGFVVQVLPHSPYTPELQLF